MTTLAPTHEPPTDARPPDLRDTAVRADVTKAARAAALRSILISIVGLLAVIAMILTLPAADPGFAR